MNKTDTREQRVFVITVVSRLRNQVILDRNVAPEMLFKTLFFV
jgi:hypothetical protein